MAATTRAKHVHRTYCLQYGYLHFQNYLSAPWHSTDTYLSDNAIPIISLDRSENLSHSCLNFPTILVDNESPHQEAYI